MAQPEFATAATYSARRPILALTETPPPPNSGLVNASIPPARLIDGRYRILGQLAAGGMGIIYSAEDVLLQRPAAIKVIEPKLAQSAETVDLFRREARALARLRHDNVVQIYAFGKTGDSYFFAMEYIDGENLDSIIHQCRVAHTTLGVDRCLEILTKVASGLTAAHGRNVVHRDIKPANIVIERDSGRPVLVDFGIARRMGETQGDSASGTPTYMAPEQIRNDKSARESGHLADVYSLACSAFEMLCGRPPFDSDHPYQLMFSHMEEAPPLISSIRPEYAMFDAAFARALAKSPKYRQESCVAFIDELVTAWKGLPEIAVDVELELDVPLEVELEVDPAAVHAPRVLILAEEDGLRRSLVREATRSLRKVGYDNPEVECTGRAGDVFKAFATRKPTLVVLDDDCAAGTSISIARRIREMNGGGEANILVLTRDMLAERSLWHSIRAQRMSKPLSVRALSALLDDLVLSQA